MQVEPLPAFANLSPGGEALALGAHRGMGANRWLGDGTPPGCFAHRENTIKSFLRAVSHGATFIELDVQVTADGVPVIWHDDHVFSGPLSAPCSRRICELTAEEFQRLDPARPALKGAASGDGYESDGSSTIRGGSSDSLVSLASTSSGRSGLLRKPRCDRPAVPFEAGLSTWDCEEEDHLPTLEEALAALPRWVGVNIEIKMTTPADAPRSPPEEVERMVMATLGVARSKAGGRSIVISSFDPEACLELKRRSCEWPVLFLSGGGAYAHVDTRRISIPAAIEFASGAGLQGIVLETFRLQQEAHLVSVAVSAGLAIMTYGVVNNDIVWVERQLELGVCAVIVDDVARVATELGAKDRLVVIEELAEAF